MWWIQLLAAREPELNPAATCGAVFWVALMLWGLAKCSAIAKRDGVNKKCVYGLSIVLTAWLISCVLGMLGRHGVLAPAGAAALLFVVLVAIIAGCVVAIIGLSEYYSDRRRWLGGSGQAIWALVLALVFVSLVGAGFYYAWQRGELEATPPIASRGGGSQTFRELNFRFNAPSDEWRKFKPGAINPDATTAYVKLKPQTFFFVIAEKVGVEYDFTLDQLVEVAESFLVSAAETVDTDDKRAVTIEGIAGRQIEGRMRIMGHEVTFVHWLGIRNGYAYQLVLRGRSQSLGALRREARQVFAGFKLLDPERVGHAEGFDSMSDVDEPYYGYRLLLSGTGWQESPDITDGFPEARVGGARVDQATSFLVTPVDLQGLDPPLEMLGDVLFQASHMDFGAMKPTRQRELEIAGRQGVEYIFDDDVDGQSYRNVARVLKGHDRAYLLAGWTLTATPQQLEVVIDTLDQMQFRAPDATGGPPPGDRSRQGSLYNQIGIRYYTASRYELAAAWFDRALKARPDDVQFLINQVDALSELGRDAEALTLIDQHAARFADHQGLMARQALLRAGQNDADRAIKQLAGLFAAGYRNDDDFETYLTLVSDTLGAEEAVRRLDQYTGDNPSVSMAVTKAYLLAGLGEFDAAVELLRGLRERHPRQYDLGYALADILDDADRDEEALATIAEMIDQGHEDADVLHLRGVIEYDLKRYRHAKASFEAALKLAPTYETTRGFLDHVSGMLGEGANTLIKTPIDPAPEPAGLWADAPTQPTDPAAVAPLGYYVRRAYVVEFVPNERYRTTEYTTTQITSAEAAARFSELRFTFDPLSESIYVNRLEVFDEAGQRVAEGKPQEYYVIDESDGTIVSQDKTLHIPVPALKAGYRLEVVVTREETGVDEQVPYDVRFLASGTPTLRFAVVYRGPRDRFRHVATPGLEAKALDGALVWSVDHPTPYRWESRQPSLDAFMPRVVWSDAQVTWEQVAREYLGDIADRVPTPGDTARIAQETVDGVADHADRVAALVGYVRDGLTYKAIEFGRRARIMNPTPLTLRNKYGDCKDHALLLKQMLESAGVEAHLALIDTATPLIRELPSLDQFDHMIVWMPGEGPGGGCAIDATDKEIDPAIDVPIGLGGRTMLVLDPAGPKLIDLPPHAAASNRISIVRRARLADNHEDLDIDETLRFTGYYASWVRTYFRGVEVDRRREWMHSVLTGAGAKVAVRDIRIDALDDRTQPLTIELRYTVRDVLHRVGDQFVGRLPALFEQDVIDAEFIERRETPFEVTYPIALDTELTLTLPDGAMLSDGPGDRAEHDNPFVAWSIESSREGLTVTMRARVETKRGAFAADQYGDFHDAHEQVRAGLSPKLALRIAPAPLAPAAPPGDAD